MKGAGLSPFPPVGLTLFLGLSDLSTTPQQLNTCLFSYFSSSTLRPKTKNNSNNNVTPSRQRVYLVVVEEFPEEGEYHRHEGGQESCANEDDDGLPHLHRGLDAMGHRHVTGSVQQLPALARVE